MCVLEVWLMHGVVVKKDGTTVILTIGEEEDDPVFFISDLLIHLASEQMEKKASKVIEGEALDIIVGNKPLLLKNNTKAKKLKTSRKPSLPKLPVWLEVRPKVSEISKL